MSKNILIADDDHTLTRLIRKFLEDNDYDVMVAHDGEEAIARYRERRPDLMILDVQMPKMNGYAVLFEMRKIDPAVVPVIVLTCKEEMEDIFRVEGVKEYLVKPVKNSELLEKIRLHI